MNNIKYGLLLLVCLFLTSSDVMAVTVNDDVVTPKFREAGDKLKLSEIKEIRSYCGALPGDYSYNTVNVTTIITKPLTPIKLELPMGVSHCVHTCVDTGDRESLYSLDTTYNITAAPVKKSRPVAPTVPKGKTVDRVIQPVVQSRLQ